MVQNDLGDILTSSNAIPVGTPVTFILSGIGKVVEFVEKPWPQPCFYKVKVTQASFFYDLDEIEIFYHKQITPIENGTI